jgi:hypothetical protein
MARFAADRAGMVPTESRRDKEGMTEPESACWRCGAPLASVERIGRRDACVDCGTELHCCRGCRHHAPGVHNECREPQAEPQVDKERSNFCDYFSPASRKAQDAASLAARAELATLFGRRRRA